MTEHAETPLRSMTLLVHRAGGTWWAESPEVPGFSAAAGGFSELLGVVDEALGGAAQELERLDVRIVDDTPVEVVDGEDTYRPIRLAPYQGDLDVI